MPVPIVFHPIYTSRATRNRRFPGNRNQAIWDSLQAAGLATPRNVHRPAPAPRWWIELAHDADYVADMFDGSIDATAMRRVGLDWSDELIARIRHSIGGTVLAGKLALQYGLACNTAGGSHHALSGAGAGYCVFNDVAVACRVLQAQGLASQFAVVDLDVHQGDGTAEIFSGDPSVRTFSLHCAQNFPVRKQKSDLDVALPKGAGDDDYLAALSQHLPEFLTAQAVDLIYYNAGVDPHDGDRLGLLRLSDDGLARREDYVVGLCRRLGLPLATVVGGGYGDDVAALAGRHMHVYRAADRYFRYGAKEKS